MSRLEPEEIAVIPRENVVSSNIESIGYDSDSETLVIEFHSGNAVYAYFNVPSDIWDGLRSASSAGKYFLASIKGVYDFQKI